MILTGCEHSALAGCAMADDTTPVVTTVHSSQLVPDDVVVIESHDSPLDIVATELELIRTGSTAKKPMSVDWERVRPDQFENIPFLTRLRDRMLGLKAAQ